MTQCKFPGHNVPTWPRIVTACVPHSDFYQIKSNNVPNNEPNIKPNIELNIEPNIEPNILTPLDLYTAALCAALCNFSF